MKFLSLTLKGFKKYLDHKFSYTPGLNLVIGPNESGKTTLHQGLITALYGLGSKSSQLLRTKEQALHFKHKDICSMELTFSLGTNEVYKIERDILNGTNKLYEQDKDENYFRIINEDSKKINAFIGEKTNIPSPDIFNQTISIRQNHISTLNSKDITSIGETIESIFSGEEQASVSAVFERLNTIRKSLKKQRNENPGIIDQLQANQQKLDDQVVIARQRKKIERKLQQTIEKLEQVIPVQQQRKAELENLLETSQKKAAKQQELASKREAWSELKKRVYILEATHKELQEYKDRLAALSYFSKAPKETIQQLFIVTKELADIDKAIAEEETRYQQKQEEIRIIMQNQNVFLNLKNILIASVFVALGLIGGLYIRLWWMFGIAGVAPVYLLLVYLKARKKYQLTEMKSEQHEQLIIQRAEHVPAALPLLKQCGLPEEVLDHPIKLSEEAHEFMNMSEELEKMQKHYDLLIGDDSLEALQKTMEDVTAQGAMLSKQIEELGTTDASTEELAQWNNELQKLNAALPQNEKTLHEGRGKLEQMRQDYQDLNALLGEQEYTQKQIQDLEKRYQAVRIAIETLQTVVLTYNAEYLPQLENRVSESFAQITENRYPIVKLQDSWPEIQLPADEEHLFAYNTLSQGAIDQLFFAFRVAVADLMSKDIQLPLLLDDPFVHCDSKRYHQVLILLANLSKQRQIIYFTTKKHSAKEFQKLLSTDQAINMIELKR